MSAPSSAAEPHAGAALAAEALRRTDGAVPGLSVAVVRRGEAPVVGSAGVASVVDGTPMTPATTSLWFSMTKIVTATAAVQLAERGALGLDDPVGRFLPAFPEPRTGGPVTVRHLLGHTAGLANPMPVRWVHPAGATGHDPDRFAADLLQRHRKVRDAPGTRAAYSNLGYVALGEVIARAAGQPFASHVRAAVLEPLGMRDTDFHHRSPAAAGVAVGHQRFLHPMTPLFRALLPRGIVRGRHGRWLVFEPFEVDGLAYGGLVGPAADAARFLAMHVADGEHEGGRILSADGARAMRDLTAHGRRLDVGLGWYRRRADAEADPYVEHLGGGGGFWNVMRLYPDRGVGVLAMGNSTRYDHRRVVSTALGRAAR